MEENKSDTCDEISALEFDENRLNRDSGYTELLHNYVEHHTKVNSQKLLFKWVFFFAICVVFVFVIIFGTLGIWNITQKNYITLEDLGAALAGLSSILSVIIVLPNQIAKSLFPDSGEQISLGLVKTMLDYDVSIKPNVSKNDNGAKSMIVTIEGDKRDK